MNKEMARNPISTTRVRIFILQSPQMTVKCKAELPRFRKGHIFNGALTNTGSIWAKNI